jgi:hypothetical protein
MKAPSKQSRKVMPWHRLDPAEATRVIVYCYGEGAGAEVLLRAFLEERDMNPDAVRFWLEVYRGLGESRPPPLLRKAPDT